MFRMCSFFVRRNQTLSNVGETVRGPSPLRRGVLVLVRASVLMRAKAKGGHREECSHRHNETDWHQLTDWLGRLTGASLAGSTNTQRPGYGTGLLALKYLSHICYSLISSMFTSIFIKVLRLKQIPFKDKQYNLSVNTVWLLALNSEPIGSYGSLKSSTQKYSLCFKKAQ